VNTENLFTYPAPQYKTFHNTAMKTPLITTVVLATLCFVATNATAELYKCRSNTGGVEYSDAPCPSAARRDGDQWVKVEAEQKQKEAEAKRVKERIEREAKSSVIQPSASVADDFFGQPQRFCSALVSDGLRTEGWKASKAMPGEWLCMSTLIPFGTVGSNSMANNIALYINGTNSNRANDIRIKININNAAERLQAFSRLDSVTKSLFKAISHPIPTDLSIAISQQKPISVNTSFGKVELIFEPGQIDSFKVVLTDSRVLSAKEQVLNSSAGDFGLCKAVVGKAAGYSASLLSGDGVPVPEANYKSFMLKGQGKDLFFCEVYSGNRYKVKAALGGNFPFKYIAEGSF
jgi:Family of unknown function (DUF6030)/Domain of unknown function (DUF4124)